ncbi:PREDICTED: tigger transposable element-derived protein 6-like isoform X2 [Priapulus caudatus]|uniref:Tigger transposable element-derived protein 6-like isoform X2 n=1 Tax=Priapulus caudatus TaxID=37621 RepID=A0ABM1F030_PRICU|nr:PREDICTED: tigger transposable element-derived protein 6-like isoform X2 [Priapulus caudatus]
MNGRHFEEITVPVSSQIFKKMPREYKRKSTRNSWDTVSMEQAITAVRSKEMGLKRASRQFNVPKTTLKRRVHDTNKKAKGASKVLGRYETVLTPEMESDLVRYVVLMEERMFGIGTKELRSLAYQIAERNEINHCFKNEIAGKDWMTNFLQRHQELSLRKPENTSAARANGFNRDAVGRFFDILEAVCQEHQFLPSNIYNCDETGVTTVPNTPSSVLALRGRRQVGNRTSAERGTLTTTEICMSATGQFIPPLFIFPRVRENRQLMDAAPPGAVAAYHKSGWMQVDIFVRWFRHFIQQSGATVENKVLLILDGHATHTQNLEVIDLARANGVYIVSIPPHTSHKLQPLDVSFMRPLSTFYTQEVERWLRDHPGRCVTIYQVAALFTEAYLKSATALTARNGFRKTGIFPLNRDIFQDYEFAPADATDVYRDQQPQPQIPEAPNQQPEIPDDADQQPEIEGAPDQQPEIPDVPDQLEVPETHAKEAEKKKAKAPSRKRSAEHITASPYQRKLKSAKKLKTGKSQQQTVEKTKRIPKSGSLHTVQLSLSQTGRFVFRSVSTGDLRDYPKAWSFMFKIVVGSSTDVNFGVSAGDLHDYPKA